MWCVCDGFMLSQWLVAAITQHRSTVVAGKRGGGTHRGSRHVRCLEVFIITQSDVSTRGCAHPQKRTSLDPRALDDDVSPNSLLLYSTYIDAIVTVV